MDEGAAKSFSVHERRTDMINGFFKAAGYDNRAVLDVLVLAATKLISNYTNHLAQTPNDAFMKGAEWTAPGKLKPAA
jgi:hypothetical protein